MTKDPPFAGNVMPADAFDALTRDQDSVLVDVRTEPEWRFVGLPDLTAIGKQVKLVQWQTYPAGQPNTAFVQECEAAGVSKGKPIYFLCRSGVRSMHAAVAMTARGYGPCYNVAQGFEGDKDADMHRGRIGGWKVAGLPWSQE